MSGADCFPTVVGGAAVDVDIDLDPDWDVDDEPETERSPRPPADRSPRHRRAPLLPSRRSRWGRMTPSPRLPTEDTVDDPGENPDVDPAEYPTEPDEFAVPLEGGTRRARLAATRRRRSQLIGLGVVALVAVVGGVLVASAGLVPSVPAPTLGGLGWAGPEAEGPDVVADAPAPEVAADAAPTQAAAAPTQAGATGGEQATLLLLRVPEPGGPAEGVTLLAAGPADAPGAVVFLPAGMLVDVPGVGLQPLGLAQQYGGSSLTEATVENALGIELDATASVSDSGLAALLERTGGLTIGIDERLESTEETPGFEPGPQDLDGEGLAGYWAFQGEGETELDAFPRQQRILAALLVAAAADPDVLDRVLAGGAPQLETTAEPEVAQGVLAGLAQGAAEDRLRVTVAPVRPLGNSGADGQATYQARDQELDDLVDELLAGSQPEEGGGTPARVQVLNGVGTPGIGAEVAEALGGGALQITSSDNAASFDYDETLVLVYDESASSLEDARTVQERLGVGTIRLSRRPQSVVDLTVVVGADFAGRPGSTPDEEPDT